MSKVNGITTYPLSSGNECRNGETPYATTSPKQVEEIRAIDGVTRVVPFFYRSITISTANKNINTNLYLIENQEDLPYTVFSDNLKVQNLSTNEGNVLFVSDSFANAANVKLSDN